jgi:hypothetical protein
MWPPIRLGGGLSKGAEEDRGVITGSPSGPRARPGAARLAAPGIPDPPPPPLPLCNPPPPPPPLGDGAALSISNIRFKSNACGMEFLNQQRPPCLSLASSFWFDDRAFCCVRARDAGWNAFPNSQARCFALSPPFLFALKVSSWAFRASRVWCLLSPARSCLRYSALPPLSVFLFFR